MEKEKTAVDWLINELTKVERNLTNKTFLQLDNSISGQILKNIFKQCKDLEKRQIENAFNEGENNSVDYFNPENRIKESEQYYNETYGGNK